MEKINLKKLLLNNCVVIFDTNVFLNIYKYSPEFTNFALNCIDTIKKNVIIPATVNLEFRKHRKKEFYAMKNKVKAANRNIKTQVDTTKNKIANSCEVLKAMQYPDIDELCESIKEKYTEIEKIIDSFFEDRSVLSQIANPWEEIDCINELYKEITEYGLLFPFSQEELYAICEDGENRYKRKIPPGYMDEKNKDGIRKYSDLIIWKEIIKYAKEHTVDVLFVTDDVKKDWWENEDSFNPQLIQEFKDLTGRIIYSYTSVDFYSKISEDFGINKTDAIEIALRLTDSDYFERVEEKVFDRIIDDITWSVESLIDPYSASDIGSEGLDDLEIIDYEFIDALQIERQDLEIIYQFKYSIKVGGISFNYWGRDDDTKEVILSNGAYHTFGGDIIVNVSRQIGPYIDYDDDSDFEEVTIKSGNLKQIEYNELSENDECDGYTTCPICGLPINSKNDTLTGFCAECERKV